MSSLPDKAKAMPLTFSDMRADTATLRPQLVTNAGRLPVSC
jgi:hypothetical protein